ncbi:permease-like cell division protein FtsX [Candidatus Saccharibacteria bacterium]|nr:permease-like cell division protein FtsX [Candidatus Saccharibacteria bacterium]
MSENITDNKKLLKKNAKKSLRAMRKIQGHHIVREKVRVVKYGASGFVRNIWLSAAATVVMAITLIILFVTVIASSILASTADAMREKIDITIFLKPNTSERVLDKLTRVVSEDPNTKTVTTSSSEQEAEKLIADSSEYENFNEILDDDMKNAILSQMPAIMRIKVFDLNKIDDLKKIVETDEMFIKYIHEEKEPTYDVNQAEIATVTSWANIARAAGIVLGVIFLAISTLIIFSTIRMAIFSRREEIYMMKLVGADKGFIRGPFIIEAEICGIIAGVISSTSSYFLFKFVAPKLADYGISVEQISGIMNSNRLVFVILAFIAGGFIIGRISSRLAVSRYLHNNSKRTK